MKAKPRIATFVLVATALLLGTAVPAFAGPGLGNSPVVTHPLSSGLNVGVLEPGESVWYAIDQVEFGPSNRGLVLNLIYKPGDGDVSPYVNFQVFAQSEVDRWLQGYADSYTGLGTYITTDFDQETAERLWSGALPLEGSYYVRLFNNSNATVEYHLMALGQEGAVQPTRTEPMEEPAVNRIETAAVSDAPLKAEVAPADVSSYQQGSLAPVSANAVPAITTVANTSPASMQWQLVASAIQNMSATDAAAWLQMASQLGWLPGVSGSNTAPASYVTPRLPEPAYATNQPATTSAGVATSIQPAPQPVPAAAPPTLLDLYPNVYPVVPLVLKDGANVGNLAPGGEHWYSFMREDLDGKLFAHMAMTLFVTPTDGNTSHDVNFQIFTGNQLQIWERGDANSMISMGEGEWVSRDKDPVTGERLWAGTVVDGDTYYVRIFNHTQQLIDYYLITNDIINTELGDKVYAANPGYWNPLVRPPLPIR